MKTYNIQTIGCQMNAADSHSVARALDELGLQPTEDMRTADVVVLNTCVVREHAERKCHGRLHYLGSLKKKRPEMIVALMGCLVGVRKDQNLAERYPFVDLLLAPSEYEPLVQLIKERIGMPSAEAPASGCPDAAISRREASYSDITALIPAVIGCSHTCAFCVIPYRRGPEKSRPPAEIHQHVSRVVREGVKEIILLGQIVDRYGLDLGSDYNLARLLREVAGIEAISRIRFLTSHPTWMTDEIIETVATSDKICPQFEIAVQSGNNEILRRMRRGHTADDFRRIVDRIRQRIPDSAIHTDVIVGFPGETEEQFMDTCRLLQELELDKVHIAAYSPRPGTFAARNYPDDVPPEEKHRRLKIVEELQRDIQLRKNRQLLGKTVTILVEDWRKGRWYGRTRQNRVVFAEDHSQACLRGKIVDVRVTGCGPYSLTGKVSAVQDV